MHSLVISYPVIDPVAFHIGPVSIHWYALAYSGRRGVHVDFLQTRSSSMMLIGTALLGQIRRASIILSCIFFSAR